MDGTVALKALSGRCIIELEALPKDEMVNGIWLPQKERSIADVGKCIDAKPGKREEALAATILNKRVGLKPGFGRHFVLGDKEYAVAYIRDAIAIFPKKADLTSTTGVERCRYCPSKGEANIILDGDGICPTCGKNRAGKKHRDHTHTMSDGEREIGTRFEQSCSEEEEHELGGPFEEDYVPEGSVTSYPGMKKRGSRSHKARTMKDVRKGR